MSRSGYNDYDPWGLIRWRGAVASALAALDQHRKEVK